MIILIRVLVNVLIIMYASYSRERIFANRHAFFVTCIVQILFYELVDLNHSLPDDLLDYERQIDQFFLLQNVVLKCTCICVVVMLCGCTWFDFRLCGEEFGKGMGGRLKMTHEPKHT